MSFSLKLFALLFTSITMKWLILEKQWFQREIIRIVRPLYKSLFKIIKLVLLIQGMKIVHMLKQKLDLSFICNIAGWFRKKIYTVCNES